MKRTIYKICYRSLTTGKEVFSATSYNSEDSAQKVAIRLYAEALAVGRPVVHSVVPFIVFDK